LPTPPFSFAMVMVIVILISVDLRKFTTKTQW